MQPSSLQTLVRKLQIWPRAPSDVVAAGRELAGLCPAAETPGTTKAKASRRRTEMRRREEWYMTRLLGEPSTAAPIDREGGSAEKKTE
jgi:hypothetical protein